MAKGILDGIKAISMGSAWAGPYMGRVLIELGAEVFRVAFPGPPRSAAYVGTPEQTEAFKKNLVAKGMPEADAEKSIKRNPAYVGNYQTNNYGIGLDLTNDKGKEVYKQLVKVTDIVIDGWSPRVMTNLGLGYDVLREIKPDIIYVSMPGMGMTGSEKDVRLYGTGIEFLSGLTSIRGYLDGPPHRAHGFNNDGMGPPHYLAAIFAALNYRADTGKGQQIDVSQAESATFIMGEAIMDYSINGRITKPTGNRHSVYAPHNCYRCKGDDMWVTIAVTSEEEWGYFCKAIGNPEWVGDIKFADTLSRWQNQEELDKLIEKWTIQYDHYTIQRILQEAGVPAAAVVTIEEHMLHDPQVKERDIYQWLTYHDGIADPIFRVPWVLSKTPTIKLARCAPYTGQHNDYLLKEVLGMSEEEIAKLADEKIIGVVPPSSF